MRRRDKGLIDMTPLLDVVFILLFALILNVNVTRAQDKAETEALFTEVETSLARSIAENKKLEEALEVKEAEIENWDQNLLEAMEAYKGLEIEKQALEETLDQKEDLIETFSNELSQVLDRQIELSLEDIPDDWLTSEGSENLIEEWLKYKQIGDRYLFVDIKVNATSGLIDINGDQTGIVITKEVAENPEDKTQALEDLVAALRNWLANEQGGTQFVFVSVVQDGQIYRKVENTVMDALTKVQQLYDKEFYLINRF